MSVAIELTTEARAYIVAKLGQAACERPVVHVGWIAATADLRRLPDGSSQIERRPGRGYFAFPDLAKFERRPHVRSVDGVPIVFDEPPSLDPTHPDPHYTLRISLRDGMLCAELERTDRP